MEVDSRKRVQGCVRAKEVLDGIPITVRIPEKRMKNYKNYKATQDKGELKCRDSSESRVRVRKKG